MASSTTMPPASSSSVMADTGGNSGSSRGASVASSPRARRVGLARERVLLMATSAAAPSSHWMPERGELLISAS